MWRRWAVAAGLASALLWPLPSPTSAFDPSWTSYTPTMTATVTNPSLGNGTLTGRYKPLGGYTYKVEVYYQRGSTGTAGSGQYRWALPYSATGAQTIIGCFGHAVDSATTWYVLVARAPLTAYLEVVSADASGSRFVSNTVPFSWGTDDYILLSCILDLNGPYADTEFSDGAPGPPGATGPPGADGAAGPTGPPGEACPTPEASAEADCIVEVSAFTGPALDVLQLQTFTLVIGAGLGLICLAWIAIAGMRR